MKKTHRTLLSLALVVSFLPGCAPQAEPPSQTQQTSAVTAAPESEPASDPASVKPLRVAVQSQYCSSVVSYILENGLDKQAGIPFEISVFNGGVPINEAMAAGLCDVAITGGAAIFALAQFDVKLLGYQLDSTGGTGNAVFVRNDNPILSVKGHNPEYPNIYGSPETVKGQVLLQNTGSVSQYLAVSYLTALGMRESDMEIVSLDFPQLYSSFATGQGDLSAILPPFSYQAANHEDWTIAATFEDLNMQTYELLVCTEDALSTRREDVVKFVDLIYQANDEIVSEDKVFDVAKKWYADNGREITDEDLQLEVDTKPYITSEEAQTIQLKDYCMSIVDFYIENDLIEPDRRSVIESAIAQDVFDEAVKD